MQGLRLLLGLLPKAFRREYGEEILDTALEHWRAVRGTRGVVGRCRFWLRQWLAILEISLTLRRQRGPRGALDRSAFHRVDMGRGDAGRVVARRRGAWLDGLGSEIRQTLRGLMARPRFVVPAVLTLGLGIGATTAMFSTVVSVLLRPLPFPQADELVVLRQTEGRDGVLAAGISAANLHDVAALSTTLDGVALAETHGLRWVDAGRAHSLRAWLVSEAFFEVLGTSAQLGRALVSEDFATDSEPVVLLSHATWQTRFAGDPGVLGRRLRLDGLPTTVVGVLPAGFGYPAEADLWAPRPAAMDDAGRRGSATLEGIARRLSGVPLEQVEAELAGIAKGLASKFPGANADLGLRAIALEEHLLGDVSTPLLVLLGAVGLVLLIAVANVTGLLLVRGTGRTRELAIRGALGAGVGRLLRLVLLDGLALATAGCVVGLLLAQLGLELLAVLGSASLPRLDGLRLDLPMAAFAGLVALVSALAASLSPARRVSRVALRGSLGEGSRGSSAGPQTGRLRERLMVAEIALALMLSVGAGLLLRSFDRLLDNDLGFDPQGLVAAQVWAYDDQHEARPEFFARGVEEISTIPGVEAVGLTSTLPLADDRSLLARDWTIPFHLEGQATHGLKEPEASLVVIDSGLVPALGLTVRSGRGFSPADRDDSAPVALVNQAFAKRFLADGDPVGRGLTLRWRDGEPRQIVGVLSDVRRRGLESEPRPEVYVPLAQEPVNGLTFVVRSRLDPATLVGPVQEALWRTDPSQATWAIRSVDALLGGWLQQRRFNTAILLTFAGLALGLSALGLYAQVAYSVEQRIAELGIRRALGGQTRDILALVLRRSLGVALAGVGLGLVGSLAFARWLRSLLFGIDPWDPFTLVALSLGVVLVALVAAMIPALRATRVSAVTALRSS